MVKGADEHLTSTEAAKLLGVSAATVKRWSDDGVLTTVRTPGGHRRFRRADLSLAAERLFRRTGGPELAELLFAPRSVLEIQAHLLAERARLGSWLAVADACSPALMAVSARGRSGEVPYLATVVAWTLLEAALSRCADEMPTRPDAPRALVASVDEEARGVELALLRLCLRAAAWTVWSAGVCEAAQIASFLGGGGAEVVVLHAGVTRSRAALDGVVSVVWPACNRTDTSLVLAGTGPWPATSNAAVARTTADLQAWIEASEQHCHLLGGVRT